MDENKIVDEIIDALTKNQKILDEEKDLTIRELVKFVADLNYSFLEIVKNIKKIRYTETEFNKTEDNKIASMFS